MLMTGCAGLFTSTKAINLDGSSYALDVKQRVVFSKARNGKVICAEPSPDALTVISASAGAGTAAAIQAAERRSTETPDERGIEERQSSERSGNASGSASVAAALAEQGAFIGLRTQSIQLLRDTMYRLCEGYASGAITDAEFTAMQRRYQSTMLGLLAIEQLTRPVVAAQVVLASSAFSNAGQTPAEGAVDKAVTRADTKSGEDVTARQQLGAAEGELADAQRMLAANIQEGNAARQVAANADGGDAASKKAAGDAAEKPFVDARPGLKQAEANATRKVAEAKIKAGATSKALQDADAELARARTAASASAAGGGQLQTVRDSSAQMTRDLTEGVRAIVGDINNSYLVDGCFALISRTLDPVSFPAEVSSGAISPLEAETRKSADIRRSQLLETGTRLCADILSRDLAKRSNQ
jgi:hypothetical protein